MAALSISTSEMARDKGCEGSQDFAITMDFCRNCFISDVDSFAATGVTVGAGEYNPNPASSPVHLHSGGFKLRDSRLVTISNCKLQNPKCHNGSGNGYLFTFSRSNDILVTDSSGLNGRHNFSPNFEFGNAGIVFQRIVSLGGYYADIGNSGTPGGSPSDSHNALACIACLWDNATFSDGLDMKNRGSSSGNAGITSTGSVGWNLNGIARDDDLTNWETSDLPAEAQKLPVVRSYQGKFGYIVGTRGKWAKIVNDDKVSFPDW